LSENALSGVLLASDIPVITGLTQGVSPLGSRHVVTECRNNILVTLDERPALDVFREDIGDVLSRDFSRVAGYIFAGLPVRGSDTGDSWCVTWSASIPRRNWLRSVTWSNPVIR